MGTTVFLSVFSEAQAYIASLHWSSIVTFLSSLSIVFGDGHFRGSDPAPRPKCVRCGKTGDYEDRFCEYCGGDLENDYSAMPHLCPRCGEYRDKKEKYCTTCGGPLSVCKYGHQKLSNPQRVDVPTCKMCSNGHVSFGSFCGECGGKTTERPVAHMKCPSCGHMPGTIFADKSSRPKDVKDIYSREKFCTNCGAAMQICNWSSGTNRIRRLPQTKFQRRAGPTPRVGEETAMFVSSVHPSSHLRDADWGR